MKEYTHTNSLSAEMLCCFEHNISSFFVCLCSICEERFIFLLSLISVRWKCAQCWFTTFVYAWKNLSKQFWGSLAFFSKLAYVVLCFIPYLHKSNAYFFFSLCWFLNTHVIFGTKTDMTWTFLFFFSFSMWLRRPSRSDSLNARRSQLLCNLGAEQCTEKVNMNFETIWCEMLRKTRQRKNRMVQGTERGGARAQDWVARNLYLRWFLTPLLRVWLRTVMRRTFCDARCWAHFSSVPSQIMSAYLLLRYFWKPSPVLSEPLLLGCSWLASRKCDCIIIAIFVFHFRGTKALPAHYIRVRIVYT